MAYLMRTAVDHLFFGQKRERETNPFLAEDVFFKLELVEESLGGDIFPNFEIPQSPGRDIEVATIKTMPMKAGVSKPRGQARLLHDLANIEIQAMELGLRTLCEFPHSPEEFKKELVTIVQDEARHLRLCLQGLENLGFSWGEWPCHLALWESVSADDQLLDRILIVHRYLEGAGLDSGERIIRKLSGLKTKWVGEIVAVISEEEIGHVQFGSRWYRNVCELEGLDPNKDFPERMKSICHKVPKRMEKLNHPLRMKAGFTEDEIHFLEDLQKNFFEV